ncbi:hypothetical protein BJ322DRAFT_1068494 [Thelephora terrestris]|uniref:Uncharacterized protein n=1 Tax=Thelephora terrestris TaxID=56493 RepID=A0A9P6HFD1_9AGAM|nr:hypothetical protein BJ322DRAFT_1068494 [Thelephora terrestris]
MRTSVCKLESPSRQEELEVRSQSHRILNQQNDITVNTPTTQVSSRRFTLTFAPKKCSEALPIRYSPQYFPSYPPIFQHARLHDHRCSIWIFRRGISILSCTPCELGPERIFGLVLSLSLMNRTGIDLTITAARMGDWLAQERGEIGPAWGIRLSGDAGGELSAVSSVSTYPRYTGR